MIVSSQTTFKVSEAIPSHFIARARPMGSDQQLPRHDNPSTNQRLLQSSGEIRGFSSPAALKGPLIGAWVVVELELLI